jgi:hypothetical protein
MNHKKPKCKTGITECLLKYHPSKKFKVKIRFKENDLYYAIKNAGGKYNPKESVWLLDYKTILMLGIEDRIVK